MTVTIAFSDGAIDGGLRSSDSGSYSSALAGSVFIGSSGAAAGGWGAWYVDGIYNAYQSFLYFDFTPPGSDERIVSAALRLTCTETYTASVSRELRAYEYDFGASVDNADWRNTAWFASNGYDVEITDAQNATAGQYLEGGSDGLATRIAASSPLPLVVVSSRSVGGSIPAGNEFSAIALGNASGTSSDPALVWTTVPASTHVHVAGAQVRLSGGAWAYLESSGAATPVVNLKYRTAAGSAPTIASVPIGTSSTDFDPSNSMQALALVADSSDNLYVLGVKGGSLGAQILVKTYRKGAGATWTALTARSYTTLAYDRDGVKGVAAAWHNAGTAGTIMCVTARGHGDWTQYPANDVMYALLSCNYLLNGTGSLVRGSGSAVGTLLALASDSSRYSRPANEVGTSLDVQAPAGGTSLRGYVHCLSGSASPGELASHPSARYILASNGTSLTAVLASAYPAWAVKDADSKTRILAISETIHAVVTVDSDSGYGPSFTILQNTGSSSSFTRLAYVRLDGAGITSLPAAATLAVTSAWDAIHDPTDGKIWLYYIDTADARRIMRTSVDLNTYQAVLDEVEVEAALGTGASSVARSIRVERNARTGDDSILVSVAVDTSGVLTTSYYVDSFNLAPDAPTLTAKTNFDADADAIFEWTFSDPNAADTQSAYQVDINLSDGTDVYDSGKLDGTITYVGTGASQAGDNVSLTPPLPTGWAPGDLLLILASIRNSGTGTVDTPTGWAVLVDLGNFVILGRHAMAGDTAPTITYTGGASGATTLAKMFAFRGVLQDFASVVHVSETQTNSSAQDVATPAATVTEDGCMIVWVGWKQDNLTSATSLGPTQSGAAVFTYSTQGDDAAAMLAYTLQTGATNITTDLFDIDGGAAAISKSAVLALLPAPDPTSESFTLPGGILDNEASYQWRIRTWDDGDEVGPWADYGTVQTSASGTVTITDPATDDPADALTDDYIIVWSVAGTTQADYRVVVTRVDTAAELVNTGWVTSADVTYTITGMLPDVQYQVAVTVRNGAAVESGTGLRYITPSYAAPETPTITIVDGDGYLMVTVTNPESGAPALGTTADGFESGVAGYDVDGGTFEASSAQAYAGTWSALLTAASAAAETSVHPDASGLVAITGGERYSVRYEAYAATSAANVADTIWWYTAASAALSSTSAASDLPASAWSTRLFTASAPASAAYAVAGVLLASPLAGQTLYVDNLVLTEASDRPTPTGNQIHRRKADGTGTTIVLADETEVARNGTWRDYTAAAGVAYEYRARAVATTGTADSVWVEDTLALQGVWVHDPLDPEGTAVQYLYGRSNRGEAIDVAASELQFAGRTYPVVEFGEQQDDTWTVRVTIPHGPTWAADVETLRAFAQTRRTLYFRDNRGRAAYCVLTGYRGDDRDEGTDVSMTIRRVDWTETTV